jgi:hypothetical protein
MLAETGQWRRHFTSFINDVMSRQQVPVACDGHHCISLDQYNHHTEQAVAAIVLDSYSIVGNRFEFWLSYRQLRLEKF